jgi:hypothetical protein
VLGFVHGWGDRVCAGSNPISDATPTKIVVDEVVGLHVITYNI